MKKDKLGSIDIEEMISSITQTISNLSKQLDQHVKAMDPVFKQQAVVSATTAQFFDNLNCLLFGTTQALEKSFEPISTDSNNTGYMLNTSRYTKKEVIATMRSMRKCGATLSEIAYRLKYKSIPTFSGRGEWHAQTVHRL